VNINAIIQGLKQVKAAAAAVLELQKQILEVLQQEGFLSPSLAESRCL